LTPDGKRAVPDAAGGAGALLPESFVREHRLLPLGRTEDGRVRLALADPDAVETIDAAAFVAEAAVTCAAAAPGQLDSGLDGRAEAASAGDIVPGGAAALAGPGAGSSAAPEESDAPVIRLVESILEDAVRRGASDVHLEPLERRFRVRMRIDGELAETESLPLALHPPVVSRLKILANLSIAEKRLPQDGRIRLAARAGSLDLRASTLPSSHGESVVLRILDRARLNLGPGELGFDPEQRRVFEELVALPDGMVLVTGPTGSGKTSTLYAGLQYLNREDRKIITVEDPVEYQIPGINQVPVNAETGMTFAAALRALLRQSPNVVMVGEIRDRETADIAVNAALTGHLLFSTLHTNDAPSAVVRLLDLGAKPFLVASALRAIVAQRLVRRICPHCRRESPATPRELGLLGPAAPRASAIRLARGAGCPACRGTGFLGRIGIFEILLVHDGIKSMIYDNVTATRLRRQAQQDGMRTMREDGLRKVLAGLTTIEEVVAVTAAEFSPEL
jgi:general secretion pathway protein E/type IV pilus assembly protein PilB